MHKISYNPDVLSCIANLSSDEVFTPPSLVNKMLDMLPNDLWSNRDAKFLDPATKSGVFLREIAKRLLVGLEAQIPDVQARIDHIFKNQIYGIATTELTSLLARRSIYCSKIANGKYSVCKFNDENGNIIFDNIEHTFLNGRCSYCGANQSGYERGIESNSYAYQFIHDNLEKIKKMKFDVIIGNPPYQLNVGVEQDNYAIPLYHKFVENAIKLNPRFLSMIIPARWYAGGRGLEEFRQNMLSDNRIRSIVDYPNAMDCFPGIDLSGGACYFLWDREYNGDCEIKSVKGSVVISILKRPLLEENCETFIRFNEAIPIIHKIQKQGEVSFNELISPQTPFGIVSSFRDYSNESFDGAIKLHTVNGVGFIKKEVITRNENLVGKHKVYISKSYGERGNYPYKFLATPFVGEPNSCCTQTYLTIGPFESKIEVDNAISYIKTRFLRFLVMQRKNTQDAMRGAYSFVPMQDFNEEWTDEKLYKNMILTMKKLILLNLWLGLWNKLWQITSFHLAPRQLQQYMDIFYPIPPTMMDWLKLVLQTVMPSLA